MRSRFDFAVSNAKYSASSYKLHALWEGSTKFTLLSHETDSLTAQLSHAAKQRHLIKQPLRSTHCTKQTQKVVIFFKLKEAISPEIFSTFLIFNLNL